MASKAYLEALKKIPKDIQNDVIGSINIANEIYLVLNQQGKSPADLARMLKKSESEISKWLTGLHNFTFKTVRNIESVLNEKIVVTNSSKVQAYEEKLQEANRKIELLNKKMNRLAKVDKLEVGFSEFLNFSCSSSLMVNASAEDDNRFLASFVINGIMDNIKIKPETASTYKLIKK